MFAAKNELFTRPSGGYQISRSLRFRSSASAYLNRTFSTSRTLNTKGTFSVWVKRGALGADSFIFGGYDGSSTGATALQFKTDNTLMFDFGGSAANSTTTTQVFRDVCAWYHIVLAIDTTSATTTITGSSTDRVRLYVNGTQVSAFSGTSVPTQNSTWMFALNTANNKIGTVWNNTGGFFDGYLAEVNFIDGQALDPTSFGSYDTTTGVWGPKKYTGTYGTNGFYLPFSNTTSTTTLVADSSGQGNNWTPNNISLASGTTYDSMIDSPTNYADGGNGRGNYAVLNPLDVNSTYFVNATFSNANLSISATSSGQYYVHPTISNNTGKFYQEFTVTSLGAGGALTNSIVVSAPGNFGAVYCAYDKSGQKYISGAWTTGWTAWTANDVIGIAVDYDAGSATYYLNGTLQGTLTFGSQGSAPLCVANNAQAGSGGTVSVSFNAGQRPFSISSIPSGFLALNTQNLPTPTIANGAQYMAAVKYDGSGSSQNVVATINNSGNNQLPTTFQPDFVWVKDRSATGANAQNHKLTDSVRGVTKGLITSAPNGTDAETTDANGVTAFLSNGFTVGTGTRAYSDSNADTYIAWQWQAGGAPTTDNVAGAGNVPTAGSVKINGSNSTSTLAGSIAATRISANTSAGFSVVTYTGTGANATVGHGLNAIPSMIIVRNRDTAGSNWPVYHTTLTGTKVIYLNLTNASSTTSTFWNNTDPTNSVFSVGTNTDVNENTKKLVAYCFAPVAGYSAFGSYTGNASADGPFVFTGFRPRWILWKPAGVTGDWVIMDTSRSSYNMMGSVLWPNLSNAEADSFVVDFLSNGFKIRSAGSNINQSATIIYAAFCEAPFKFSRAR